MSEFQCNVFAVDLTEEFGGLADCAFNGLFLGWYVYDILVAYPIV